MGELLPDRHVSAGVSPDGRLCVSAAGALVTSARRPAGPKADPMDPCPLLRNGSVSIARDRALRCASHTTKIIGKLCAGKSHAQFERGLYGNGSAFVLRPRHNLPMAIDWFPLWLSLRVAALSTLIAL